MDRPIKNEALIRFSLLLFILVLVCFFNQPFDWEPDKKGSREIKVNSTINGRLKDRWVDHGQLVRKGDTLLSLFHPKVDKKIAHQLARLAALNAQEKELEAQLRQSLARLSIEKQQYFIRAPESGVISWTQGLRPLDTVWAEEVLGKIFPSYNRYENY